MKSFFVVVVLGSIASVLAEGAFHEAAIRCAQEVKKSPDAFVDILKSRRIPDTQEEKCFMGCMYKESGLTKNGAVDEDKVKSLAKLKYAAHPEQLKKADTILEACKSIEVINDECALGFELRKCFLSNSDDSFVPFFSERI